MEKTTQVEIQDDAKKLALKCKTLEMQLRQSVSKKEHHEITSKLEKQIDSLEKELDRAREEGQKSAAITKQISGLESLINSVIKTSGSQGKTLDSIEDDGSTLAKALGAQGKVIDAVAAKISQGTVPSQVYLQSLAKIDKLEDDKRNMVRRFDYNTLEARCEDLSRQLGTMVPAADHISLKEKFEEATRQLADMVPASDYASLRQRTEELEGAFYTMVPREKFVSSQEKVKELEARLSEHVPQTVYDELVSKVMSLAEAVSGGATPVEEVSIDVQSTAEPSIEVTVAEVTEIAATQPEAAAAVADAPADAPAPIAEEVAPVAQEIAPAVVEETPAAEPVAEPAPVVAPEPAAPVEPAGPIAPEITAVAATTTEPAVAETVVAAAPEPEAYAVPEVREIQSQLAELSTQAQETHDTVVPTAAVETVTETATVAPATIDSKAPDEPAAEAATPEIVVAASEGASTTA